MEKEKKLFRETQVYQVFFMVLVTIVFVGILSLFYNSEKGRIDDNQEILYFRQILEIFNDKISQVDFYQLEDAEVLKYKEEFLIPYQIESPKGLRDYYKVVDNGRVIGYCFDIVGAGLWGTMKAVVGFEPNLETLIDFNVYEQVETPGLGGRIAEPADKLNLRADMKGSSFMQAGEITKYKLISEGSNPEKANEIRQITGATITSSSFLKMLDQEMEMIIPLFKDHLAKGE
jgi:RnfABCDGE-type electron transport complex G subunit